MLNFWQVLNSYIKKTEYSSTVKKKIVRLVGDASRRPLPPGSAIVHTCQLPYKSGVIV